MDISAYLKEYKSAQQQGQEAVARAIKEEALRCKLNADKLRKELESVTLPKLKEAESKIVAEGFFATVDQTISTGNYSVAIALRASRFNQTERSQFKLRYEADQNTALITVTIRHPQPDPNSPLEIGKFPIGELVPQVVEEHIEKLLRMAFR
jgi:hypothetical protein